MSCDLIREHGAAYALGALETEEREAVEQHAGACPTCAEELAELEGTVARLALDIPQHDPPPTLRERLLATARSEVGAGLAPPDADEPTLLMPRVPSGPTAVGGDEAESPTGPRRRIPWLSVAALAAALAALIWGAILQAQLEATRQQLAETSAQLERARGAYNTVVEVLASPATRERDLEPRDGAPSAAGKVWIDQDSGRGMLMARNLPPLPEGQAYQVWLSNPQGRVTAGFLRPYEDGVYYVVLQAPGKLTDYRNLGVTREPSGGSPGPTGPRIIGGEL